MKIAIKICMAAFAGMGLSLAAPALAAMSPPSEAAIPQAPASVLPKIDTPQIGGSTVAVSVVSTSAPPAFDIIKDKGGKEDMASPKMPDSVKGVVKRLNSATENVTLEDLNSAREAVAKLDILIDIEKRLNDLATLRQEREEKSLSNAIPASVLGSRGAPAPSPAFSPLPGPSMPPPPVVYTPLPSASIEIQRIVGAGGHYMALVKSGDGKATLVHEGDKLSDGSVVQNITGHGVTVLKNKTTRTIQVKDVAVVFNGR